MPFFSVRYTYADVDLDGLRPEHRAYLSSLAEQGFIKASGPLPGTTPAQALLIFSAESADKVRELLAEDPFQKHHFVAETEVLDWNPVIGLFKDEI